MAEFYQLISFLRLEIVVADNDFSNLVFLMNFFKILWCTEHSQSVAEAVAEAWVSVNETDDFFSAGAVDIDGGGIDIHSPFRADSVEERCDDGGFGCVVGIDMLFNERHSQRVE